MLCLPRCSAANPLKTAVACLLTLLALPAASTAGTDRWQRDLHEALRAPAGSAVRLGVCVARLPDGAILFAEHAAEPFKPASNMKLITTAAALHLLGPDFTFQTHLALRDGDVILVGGGDPLLALPRDPDGPRPPVPHLWSRWAALLADHLPHPQAPLFFDDSVFDTTWIHPSWPGDQLQRDYCAPVGGLNLAGNCVTFTVWPDRYTLAPLLADAAVRFAARPGGANRPWAVRKADPLAFEIRGTCSRRTRLQPLPVGDPGLFAASSFRAVAGDMGLSLAAPRRTAVRQPDGSLPPEVHILDTHQTPIADVLRAANTDSVNLAAEALMKMAGRAFAARTGRYEPGSWDNGRHALRDFLDRLHVDQTGLVIDDGSGLSHDNRLTPQALVRVLVAMFNSPARELYLRSLAVAGRTGTLERRMRDLAGRVFAKTGYLRGVRTLSGYVRCDDDTWLAFAIFYNGFRGPSLPYRNAQDRACRVLARYRRP